MNTTKRFTAIITTCVQPQHGTAILASYPRSLRGSAS